MLKYYAFLPLLLLSVFYTYKAIDFPIHDFSNYYFGGRFLSVGNFDANIYFPYYFNNETASSAEGLFMSYAPNTPFLALFFYPLALLPLAVAKLLFNSISSLLFIYSVKRLVSHYKIKPIYILLLPIVFFIPIKNELLFGQVYFLLFFLLAESMLAYQKEQFVKMAVFLSFAILIKVFPVFLILLFVFKKQVKPLFYTFAFCIVLFAFSLFFVDLYTWIFYFQNVLPKASNGEISTAFVANYQSVFMFLKELLVFDATENPNAFFNSPLLFEALVVAFKIGLVTIGYFVSRNITNTLFGFSYWILAAILISPYGSTYTFILLVFAYFYLASAEILIYKKAVLIGLLFLISNFPLAYFLQNPFPFSYLRLFFLGLFFIGLMVLIYKNIQWKWVLLVMFVQTLALVILKERKPISSSSFLTKNAPILVYDYTITNNKLTYFYWNEKGKNQTFIPIHLDAISSLVIKNNQVFYNEKQLTFDKSNKQKPILINRKTVLYLSDYDRGIGFYTLRKIELN